MRIVWDTFGAEIPRVDDHLLPPNYASLAENAQVIKGDLRAFRAPSKTAALTGTTVKSIYLHTENSNEHWVDSSAERHYIKSPVAAETYERAYFSGETEARFFSNDHLSGTPAAFNQATDYYKLGIPAPTAAPTVTTTAGGAGYKGYVYSFVNSYGDEGPPSPIGSDTDYDSGTVAIAAIQNAPADRAINRIYLYRTNASSTGSGAFQYVLQATWFSATTIYATGVFVIYSGALYKCTSEHAAGAWNAGHFTAGDDVADAALLAVFPKTNFDPPPTGIKGLSSMGYGGAVGFLGRDLYFSEPFYVHAYPTGYIVPLFHDIVSITVEKNMVFVATEGPPYLVYGDHPSVMSRVVYESDYPGLNIRGACAGKGGAFFVTRQGLIHNNGSGPVNVTQSLLTADDWADYHPDVLMIAWHQQKIFGFDPTGAHGFMIDFSGDTMQFIPLGLDVDAIYTSDTGYLYLAMDDVDIVDENDPPAAMPKAVKQWEGSTTNYMLYTWRSKEFVFNGPVNFSVAKVILDQDFYDTVEGLIDLTTLNAAIFAAGLTGALGIDGPIGGGHELGGDEMMTLGSIDMSTNVTFKLYAGGALKKTKTLTTADNRFRLPGKYRSDKMMIEISGFIPVKKIVIATSPEELGNASV